MAESHTAGMDPSIEVLLDRLESVLQALTRANEKLLSHLQHKQQSLREGDRQQVITWCGRENERVREISELETQRLNLVGDLTQRITPSASQPLSLQALAQLVPEPQRGRLLVRRQQLRQVMQQARHEAGVARRASESLLHHMQGLLQTIGGVMTGVYGDRGSPPRTALAVSTFNTTG